MNTERGILKIFTLVLDYLWQPTIGCCYFLPFHFHSILVFPKLKIAISFHFHCYFLPLLNLSKNEEWKEIAILKLLFPSTFLSILIIAISFHFDCYFLLLFRNYYFLPLFCMNEGAKVGCYLTASAK